MDNCFKSDTEHTSRRQAVTDIIESIAMEEKAIAHILEAEAKKICVAVSTCKPCIPDMIHINEAVCDCIKNVIKLQMLLQFKLENVKELIDDSDY